MPPKKYKEKERNPAQAPSRAIANQEEGREGRTLAVPPGPDLIQRTAIEWGSTESVKLSSGGGMGGVAFLKVGGTTYVIKPIKGSAAASLFGEQMMEEIGGAQSPGSEPIRRGSPEFKNILDQVRRLKSGEASEGSSDPNDRLKFFEEADAFLVQSEIKGTPMEEAATQPTQLNSLLEDNRFLINLGRTLAADTLIGNADRLENMNLGNIMVTGTQDVGAIDTEAIYQSRETWMRLNRGFDSSAYLSQLVSGGSKNEEDEGKMGTLSGKMFDESVFDDWFARDFKRELLRVNPALKDFNDWSLVKTLIKSGFDFGMATMADKLSGESYRDIKRRFEGLEEEYGKDINFNWRAFQLKVDMAMAISAGIPRKRALDLANLFLLYKEHQGKDKLSSKALGKIQWGYQNGHLNRSEVHLVKTVLSMIDQGSQDTLLHLKSFNFRKSEDYDKRLNAIRAAILKHIVVFLQHDDYPVAVQKAMALAQETRNSAAVEKSPKNIGDAIAMLRKLGLNPNDFFKS